MGTEFTSYLYSKQNRDLYLSFLPDRDGCKYSQTISAQFLNNIPLTGFQEAHMISCHDCQKEATTAIEKHNTFKKYFEDIDSQIVVPEFNLKKTDFTKTLETSEWDVSRLLRSVLGAIFRPTFLIPFVGFSLFFYFLNQKYGF